MALFTSTDGTAYDVTMLRRIVIEVCEEPSRLLVHEEHRVYSVDEIRPRLRALKSEHWEKEPHRHIHVFSMDKFADMAKIDIKCFVDENKQHTKKAPDAGKVD